MTKYTGSGHINIEMPLHDVYRLWVRVETYPRFLAPLEEVAQLSDTVLHWRVRFGEYRRDFDTVIADHVPRRRLAWRSLGAAFHTGSVDFAAVDDRTTRVRLQMAWDHRVLDLPDGADPGITLVDDAAVDADLRAFVHYAEEEAEAVQPQLIGGPAHPPPRTA